MYYPITGKIDAKGWMREYLERDKKGITGNLDRLCEDIGLGIFGENRTKDEIRDCWSSWWPGETDGNWSEAMVRLAFALDDTELIARAKAIVYHYIRYQDEDGYIGIYLPGERFSNGKRSGELWTQSRAMGVMREYYRHTHDNVVLEALFGMADCTVKHYGPLAGGRSHYEIPDEDGSKTHGLMITEQILALYEIEPKSEYLNFCVFLYEDYSRYASKFPCDDIQSGNLSDAQTPYIGHGPHTCEQMRIPLLLYKATKDKKYLKLFNAAVTKLKKYLLLSGSCKSDELIGAHRSELSEQERAGKDFEGCTVLPSNGFEYCSTTELMFTFLTALEITEDIAYADMEEWMILNAAMAARRPDGKAIQYLCADNLYEASKAVGDRWDYSPTHIDAAVCCAPNSCKVMPVHTGALLMHTEDGFLAALYGACTVKTSFKGVAVEICEATKYPFEQSVEFTVSPEIPVEFALQLRVPEWCIGTTVRVNGEEAAEDRAALCTSRKITLLRTWNKSDRVEVVFDARIKIKKANDGTYALSYGPLLYALDIKTRMENYFTYADAPEFHDTNYYPAEGEKWCYTLKLKTERLQDNIAVVYRANECFPWENSPVTLRVRLLDEWSIANLYTFVPIGCTLLRRTAFPAVIE